MDAFKKSLQFNNWREKLARAASIRNFIAAQEHRIVPKLAIVNVNTPIGSSWAAHICVEIIKLVKTKSGEQANARRPRFTVPEVGRVFENYRPEDDECRVERRQTDKCDDPDNLFEITVDVLRLSEYLEQVIAEYNLEQSDPIREQILVVLLHFFGSVCRANYRVSNLPEQRQGAPSSSCSPENCADIARRIAESPAEESESGSATVTDRTPRAAGQLTSTDPAQPARGQQRDTADEGDSSDIEFARKFRNLVCATERRAAKVLLCNVSNASRSERIDLAHILLELIIAARVEGKRQVNLDQYLERVSSVFLGILQNSRSKFSEGSGKPCLLLASSTQIDTKTTQGIILDIQKFETIVEGFFDQETTVTRVQIITECLELLALVESSDKDSADPQVQESNSYAMYDQWVDSSFEDEFEFPPPPQEVTGAELVARRTRDVAPTDDLFGGLGGASSSYRPQRADSRFGGPRINLPLLKTILDVETFLLKFERIMNHFEIPDRDRVLYLEQCVEGSRAEAWLTNYLRNYSGQKFSIVEVAFRKAFCSVDESRRVKSLVKARVWREGEAVSDYFIDKMVLLSKLSSSISLDDRGSYIKEGLPHNWKVRLVGMSFKSMEDMLDYLVLVEADLAEIRSGAALVEKKVSIQQPQPAAISAINLDALVQNFEKLTTTVTALQDELREARRRPETPYYRDRQGSRDYSRGRPRDRSSSWNRSSQDRYRKSDRDRYRSNSQDKYRRDDRDRYRSSSRDRYRKDDRGRYRSSSRDRSDRSRRDRYDKDRSSKSDKHRSAERDGSRNRYRDSSKDRNRSSSRDRKFQEPESKNGQK